MAKRPPVISTVDLLRCIRVRLDQASTIAKAVEVVAKQGNADKAIHMMPDVKHLSYEVTTILNAVSLLHQAADS
jgi:hypothetical protein